MDYQIYNNTIPKRCKKVMTFGRAEDLKNRESLKADDLWAPPMVPFPLQPGPGAKALALVAAWPLIYFCAPSGWKPYSNALPTEEAPEQAQDLMRKFP
jgi:hypothetical protein